MICIIGGGVAGASLAYYLKGDFDVKVYEARKDVGLKPCACGVLKEIEEFMKISKDEILNEILRCEIYLDGVKIREDSGNPLGYIIDKRRFIKRLLEGVEVEFQKRVKPDDLPKDALKVVATGHHFHKEDKMLALQYLISNAEIEEDTLKIYWTKDFVGYYWIFPYGDLANVGVGGFLKFKELRTLLDKFVGRLKCKIIKRESAFVYVGGIKEELYNMDYYVIGEALGAVYPITCEGIRPSVASAYALANAIKNGTSFKEEFEKTQIPQQIMLQRKALKILAEAPPELRAEYIKKMFEW